ncbi:unnamed protein product [Bursaphelenchus okinawaensis]|uniref:Uncharacterized protein n=1 Tax=Bursaphelenchus okinawaensis TaxID=465554 RepID=A0A811L312_9BILA|nr:unnamed protein product [Bursaphelenchus okinawaensis]CAG9115162.1 unnamed protein product [Bursaphelenchus okinawaensis]
MDFTFNPQWANIWQNAIQNPGDLPQPPNTNMYNPALGHHNLNYGQTAAMFGQNNAIFGQNGAGFGQNGAVFGQNGTAFGQNGADFGQNGAGFGQLAGFNEVYQSMYSPGCYSETATNNLNCDFMLNSNVLLRMQNSIALGQVQDACNFVADQVQNGFGGNSNGFLGGLTDAGSNLHSSGAELGTGSHSSNLESNIGNLACNLDFEAGTSNIDSTVPQNPQSSADMAISHDSTNISNPQNLSDFEAIYNNIASNSNQQNSHLNSQSLTEILNPQGSKSHARPKNLEMKSPASFPSTSASTNDQFDINLVPKAEVQTPNRPNSIDFCNFALPSSFNLQSAPPTPQTPSTQYSLSNQLQYSKSVPANHLQYSISGQSNQYFKSSAASQLQYSKSVAGSQQQYATSVPGTQQQYTNSSTGQPQYTNPSTSQLQYPNTVPSQYPNSVPSTSMAPSTSMIRKKSTNSGITYHLNLPPINSNIPYLRASKTVGFNVGLEEHKPQVITEKEKVGVRTMLQRTIILHKRLDNCIANWTFAYHDQYFRKFLSSTFFLQNSSIYCSKIVTNEGSVFGMYVMDQDRTAQSLIKMAGTLTSVMGLQRIQMMSAENLLMNFSGAVKQENGIDPRRAASVEMAMNDVFTLMMKPSNSPQQPFIQPRNVFFK